MVISLSFSYRFISNQTIESQQALTHLAQVRHLIGQVRLHTLEAYQSIDIFLLQPSQIEYRSAFFHHIDMALKETDNLRDHELVQQIDYTHDVNELIILLQGLKHEVDLLFAIRTDNQRQYPTMAIAINEVQPWHKQILSSFRIAISELEDQILGRKDTQKVYQTYMQSMLTWTQMVSTFRIYMANRIGGANETNLVAQEKDIELIYTQLQQLLTTLASFGDQGLLGFESHAALADIALAAQRWKQGYDAIRILHHTQRWRIDTLVMHDEILPRLNQINGKITDLDQATANKNGYLIDQLHATSNTQELILAAVIILLVLFIIFIIISIERTVLRPIASVARALKAEAFGNESEQFISVHSTEIQDLIDAFEKMRKKVSKRQSDLEHQALHDALTGLPNRVMLKDRLEYHILMARRNECHLALFILDLNRFKEVNDTLGHPIGDLLLIQVGQRITGLLRDVDTVARLGGDEFAILLPQTKTDQAIQIAQKLRQAFNDRFHVNDHPLQVGVSIGIAVYPHDGTDSQTLIQHADVAMYVSKRGRLAFALYDPNEDEHSIHRLALVHDLRHALEHDQLKLHFQPKLALKGGRVTGAEALLRWHHPQLGPISPEHIIELAEQIDIIDELTGWIIQHAIMECARWHQLGHRISIAVNLSVANLHSHLLQHTVEQALQEHGLKSHFLTLEITESAMMANPDLSIQVLNTLHAMGINLSVDDFGTGFSSLSYLKRLPVTEMKIDKSFVIEMISIESDAVIVHSTVELAHNLGLKVVAEGVESETHWKMLEMIECDTAQGYHMCRPIDAEAFIDWLSEHQRQRKDHPDH